MKLEIEGKQVLGGILITIMVVLIAISLLTTGYKLGENDCRASEKTIIINNTKEILVDTEIKITKTDTGDIIVRAVT